MIIWGWGRQTSKDYGPTVSLRCLNCFNTSYWRLEGRATWFTLFFVPVLPYGRTHFLSCQICSRGVELKGEQVERAKQLAALTADYMAHRMSEVDYARAVASHRLFEVASSRDLDRGSPIKTDGSTQAELLQEGYAEGKSKGLLGPVLDGYATAYAKNGRRRIEAPRRGRRPPK